MREKKPKVQNPTVRQQRRVQIAQAVMKGTPVSTIAQQVGVTRQMVNLEIRAPETQALIRSWMQPHHAAIKRMIPRALAAVHKSLKPSQKTSDRLQAVKTLGTVMGWAEGRSDDGDSSTRNLKFSGQMEELLVIYRRISTGEPSASHPPAE